MWGGWGGQPLSADCTRSSSSRAVCEKISPWLVVDWLESGGRVSTQWLNPGDIFASGATPAWRPEFVDHRRVENSWLSDTLGFRLLTHLPLPRLLLPPPPSLSL